ncbi:Putative heterokaryon incompatibility [Colletotrichum destructivum]|uniref:Heterokaryon incompatibility n=1 Tax=Colletotrichum destructivum TaxID=34406 RepID=A0AAX4IXB4_9PEZI|nr:Putative heterokaryon incompatibility [Colletotrichum destructivum]
MHLPRYVGDLGAAHLHVLSKLKNKMSTRCTRCVGVTVDNLVRLAEIEFQADEFPKEAFYQHHESFPLLEKAADAGCELCQLILKCFVHTPCDEEEPINWPGGWDEDLARHRTGQRRTMYTLAQRLVASDVKLSINASHLYSFEPLDAVEVFDEIMVQVGPSHTNDDEGYGIWGCPPLKLTLTAHKGIDTRYKDFRIRRYEVDPDLASPKTHELARQWLSDCRNNHENCVSDRKHELPTRVIDVEAGGTSHVRLVLTRGVRDAYAALSHCWGGAISPSLTTETLRPFQDSIPVGSLPPNFCDAITITREIGLRFLWIDCLCIQQDSKSDWETESKKMGSVYRNSTVTISAMVSTGSKAGILKTDLGVPLKSEPITIGMSNINGSSRISIQRKDPDEESLRRLDTESALQTRGWTLQEYILSPRHIMYGKSMVYWRCPQEFISPDGLSSGNKSPETLYKKLTNVIYSDVLSSPRTTPFDIKVVLDDYYDLISAYSGRRLTYASDKLPAFSGLAQRLHPVVGGDYLAGLWTADFRRGLLWIPEMKFCRHSNDEYRAPSWSWAVTDDKVLFEQSVTLGPSPSSAQLLDYTVHPRVPDNPYGEISALKLVLKVLTKPLVRSRQVIGTILDRASIGSAVFDEPAGDEDLTTMGSPELFRVQEEDRDYVVSVISRPGDETHWELNLALYREDEYTLILVHTDDSSEEEPGWSSSPALCLIVRQRADNTEELYERVGFARLQTPKLSWLETWERQVLTLV